MAASLASYIRALSSSEDLFGYLPFTLTATATSTQATQTLTASALIDTDNASTRKHDGAWVRCISAGSGTDAANVGLQRRVQSQGFTPTTGSLLVHRSFPAIPQSGAVFEEYRQIPAIKDDDGNDGYREIINEALRNMITQDWITLTGVNGQLRYTLDQTAYHWIAEPNRILRENGRAVIFDPYPQSGDRRARSFITGDIFPDGELMILQLYGGTYATGDAFELEVRRPGNSRLSLSGVWADQTDPMAGLILDADKAIPSVGDVVTVAREYAFGKLVKNAATDETKLWEQRRAQAAAKASPLKYVRANDLTPKPGFEIQTNMNPSAWR